MEMSAVFWIATIIMAVLAFAFIAMPMIKNNRKPGSVAIAIALPLFAAGLYWVIGSPQVSGEVTAVSRSAPQSSSPGAASQSGDAVGSVASMVDGLAARLAENPDDGKSWLLLARSYEHLHRIPEAKKAYLAAVDLGEYDAKLAAMSDSAAPAIANTAQVFGNLRLSERSKQIVLPTDTVFIFARGVDGPPMPVAALRRPVSDLPLDFLLNDTLAMTPDFKLSDFEQVTVTARISRSGIATEALQGLESKSVAILVADNQHLNLIIE